MRVPMCVRVIFPFAHTHLTSRWCQKHFEGWNWAGFFAQRCLRLINYARTWAQTLCGSAAVSNQAYLHGSGCYFATKWVCEIYSKEPAAATCGSACFPPPFKFCDRMHRFLVLFVGIPWRWKLANHFVDLTLSLVRKECVLILCIWKKKEQNNFCWTVCHFPQCWLKPFFSVLFDLPLFFLCQMILNWKVINFHILTT